MAKYFHEKAIYITTLSQFQQILEIKNTPYTQCIITDTIQSKCIKNVNTLRILCKLKGEKIMYIYPF